MPHYLIQASYKDATVAVMVGHPQDRTAAVNAIVGSAGGTVQAVYFALGEYDLVIIAELPDNATAAAVSMAVAARGSMSEFTTTALLSPDEAVAAMRKAGTLTYDPPAAAS